MQFEKPGKDGYTIYTKTNCPYCSKVKELLKSEIPEPTIIHCDSYLEDSDLKEVFLTWMQSINGSVNHRTFPMVFYQEKFIGGFTDTEKFYAKQNVFLEDVEF